MSELPNGWAALRLGEVAVPTANVDPSKWASEIFELYSVPSYSDRAPEVIVGAEIKSSEQAVQPGDVLLCKIVPHLNRVWVVGQKTDKRQIASGERIVYRNHGCDPRYLRYCLTEGSFRDRFMQTVAGVGGSLMRARPSEVAEIEVGVAPLPEQQRIVAKIDSLSAKPGRARDHLDHLPRLVEKYKQAVLAMAFRDLSKTTDYRPLETCAEYVTSGSRGWAKYYSEVGPLFIRIANVRRGQLALALDDIQRVAPPAGAEGLRTRVRGGTLSLRLPPTSDALVWCRITSKKPMSTSTLCSCG